MSSDGATLIGKQLSIEGVDSVHGGMSITQAREAMGMSLEELSAKLKVNVRKLEQIERGEFDKVAGGQAHVRGLIRAMCKAVGAEAEPILAQLPGQEKATSLDQIDTQFRTPFASSGRLGKLGTNTMPRSTRSALSAGSSGKPRISNAWIAGGMLASVAALLLYAWPAIEPLVQRASQSVTELVSQARTKATEPVAKKPATISADKPELKAANTATPAAAEMPPGLSTNVTIAPADAQTAAPLSAVSGAAAPEAAATVTQATASTTAASAASADKLVIQATAPSWVEIRGLSGNLLVSRSLSAGERLEQGLERRRYVVIGNAAGTQVWVRGKAYDVLAQASGNNVARFDIE